VKAEVRVARIERSIAVTTAELAALDVYMASAGADVMAGEALRAGYQLKLNRQKDALRSAKLAAQLAQPVVDPLQTDIEKEAKAKPKR